LVSQNKTRLELPHRVGLLPELLLEHTSCALGRLGQALLRLIERRLDALGVRSRHVGVLMALREAGTLSQQALGAHLLIDPATMVATLNDLEQRHLVRRERDDDDGRRHAVTITRAGEKFLEQAEQVLDSVDDDVLAFLTPRLQRALGQAVRELALSADVAVVVDVPRTGA
jgi:DNA-binding MarR family transcriptional regulator